MGVERGFEVLIVGAGPAGMAAAVAARASGASVGVVDDNPAPGGQIWRGEAAGPSSKAASAWFARVSEARPEILGATRIVGPLGPGQVLADTDAGPVALRYGRLILANGARELFLPFPGWTLPNVFGAGGLQALVKSGWPIVGKRVVVAGSGPLLPAVAASLRRKGADVRLVAEQAPASRLARFAAGLWRKPGKLGQAIGLRAALVGVPYQAGRWPVAAEGDGRVTSVTITDGRTVRRVACDFLACGFGLVPNVELAVALGCGLRSGFVEIDGSGQTTVADIFAAGELTGIGGLDLSLVEGEIAGHLAVGADAKARPLFPARDRARRFSQSLARAFALRDELRTLARPETIVCRCEDVAHADLAGRASWLDAKLQTRCGMGPCQGRVCGDAVAVLYGWSRTSVRPPIFPTPLGHLAS